MATENKDFRVKNGLVVANGGAFGGAVSVATPTENSHAATKQYVDSNSGAFGNIDGGKSDTVYGGVLSITGGNAGSF